MNNNILYAYGTLRHQLYDPLVGDLVKVKGTLYNIGWFPGIILGGNNDVVCEKIVVDSWDHFDAYEGYYEDDKKNSLYLRVPILDGQIYVFNRSIEGKPIITSGDWFNK